MKRSTLTLVVLAIAAAAPVFAQSVVGEAEREAIRGIPDRWGVNLGGYWQTFDVKVRLDATSGATGTDIDLESDLDLPENQASFEIAAHYRFSDRHRLVLSYVGWSRSRSALIERDIQWGDVTYHVGAELESEATAQFLNAIYTYSFINNGRVSLGVNGGVSALWTEFTLAGEGSVAGGGAASARLVESKDVLFPVPVVGVHFEMTLAERLLWTVDGNFFVASISGYDGNLNAGRTTISYYVTPHVGIGAGLSTTAYKITKDGDNDGEVRVRYGFGGPVAYASFVF